MRLFYTTCREKAILERKSKPGEGARVGSFGGPGRLARSSRGAWRRRRPGQRLPLRPWPCREGYREPPDFPSRPKAIRESTRSCVSGVKAANSSSVMSPSRRHTMRCMRAWLRDQSSKASATNLSRLWMCCWRLADSRWQMADGGGRINGSANQPSESAGKRGILPLPLGEGWGEGDAAAVGRWQLAIRGWRISESAGRRGNEAGSGRGEWTFAPGVREKNTKKAKGGKARRTN